MAEYLYQIEDLLQVYGDRTVLDIPSLRFETGKIHAITGPNGSGKTTLCSILSLLLKPTGGKVLYRGENVYDNGSVTERLRGKITMVHQHPYLFNTTVEKNLSYGLRVRKHPRSSWKPRVKECLVLMGIEHLRQERASCLSGGETQRVAMARALAVNPEVLILDEFTANVDRNYVQVMEQVLLDVFRRNSLTVFLVTHDDQQALRFAHTITHLPDSLTAAGKPFTMQIL
jgi:tungstate transport system ATP-binding protein